LEQQTGSLPLDTTEVDSFAKGSPTRGAVTATAVTERFSPDAGSRNPDRWHCEAMTVGFATSSSLRLNPPVTCGDSPPSSGALGREMSFGGRGEQQQTIM